MSEQSPSKEQVQLAYEAWWRDLTRRGDPSRRPHLTTEAFVAGWKACSDSDEIQQLRRELAKSQDAVDYYYALAKRGTAPEPPQALNERDIPLTGIWVNLTHGDTVKSTRVYHTSEVDTKIEHLTEALRQREDQLRHALDVDRAAHEPLAAPSDQQATKDAGDTDR